MNSLPKTVTRRRILSPLTRRENSRKLASSLRGKQLHKNAESLANRRNSRSEEMYAALRLGLQWAGE